MRFNKQELLTLATQPSHKFDKEGVLYIRERQEGFFRRTDRKGKTIRLEKATVQPVGCYAGKVLMERWCRLRGNLLFYFKGRDVWSEPVGVIVLEHCTIKLDLPDPLAPPFGFTLVFEGGAGQHISANTEHERDAWLEAIQTAGYSRMRGELLSLQRKLEAKRGHKPDLDVQMWRISRGHTLDPSEVPLCEVSLSCDNLLCDGHGRPPNPLLSVYVFLPSEAVWIKYSNTELVQKSSNPTFLCTVCFRASDGLSSDTKIRFTAFDIRESISQTSTPIGSACIELSALQDNDRLRIPLRGGKGAAAGFLSISVWSLEREGSNLSTESTPLRSAHQHLVWCHRRSQSLPPKLGVKLKVPHQGWFKSFFGNAIVTTYRFHSGLGGDISVHEIMAESKLCFLFPQQLLSLWMNEEKELLQEVAGMGELEEPWHSVQVDLLDRHLHLLHLYSQAKENLQAHKGSYFKASSRKTDRSLEFAPINLHLQRIWVQNETLKKCDFYDIITVGAFTAHSHKSKNGGLIKLLQQLKESPIKSKNGNPGVDKISVANDAIQAIKQLRREVVDGMRTLMKLAKEKKTSGMLPICDDMIAKTRALLSLWDPGLVEEALRFVEEHKVQRGVGTGEQTASESDSAGESPFRRIARQLRWDSPPPSDHLPVEDELATPDSPRCLAHFWHHQLAPASSPHPTDKNATDENSNLSNLEDEEERRRLLEGEECVGGRRFLDTQAMCSSPSANYYKPSEEPEPWDLTQLNIEASVMCLVSKVKFLCGRCTSPAVRLRSGNKGLGRSQSFRSELCRGGGAVTSQPSSTSQSTSAERAASRLHSTSDDCLTQAVQTATAVRNKFTEGLELSRLRDWTSELRPSMRKLRQAMDGLLKTARLTHSVFRLQEDRAAAHRACHVRYRRHVVFSHALTSVVTGLVARLWCSKADAGFCVVLSTVGPLVSFESLLSYYGEEIDMWGDMVVAVEDLRTVTFTLAPPTTSRMPKVVGGCRSVVEVVLPVPEPVFSLVGAASFHVTPVLFNVGINEKAMLAESLNATGPQRKSNADNLSRLHEYYHRFSKLGLGSGIQGGGGAASPHSRASLSDLIDQLRAEVFSNRSKNVRILHLAQLICRRMKGLRFTSCKSAKDRTGMSVTLEQVDILASEYDLAEHEHRRALDCMRSEGCRRENTGKNIGVRKYAINRLNLMTFPAAYRPPPGTYGSKQT